VSRSTVNVERYGDIAVCTIDNPPVNALAHGVRSELLEAVVAADQEATVTAIVIRGAGRHFVGGADIRELDQEPKAPLLNDVLLHVEACSKPIVIALDGAALGGGFELALAGHYRFSTHNASFGLPEIRLGLLPGSGGTQRLPRLIGAAEALNLMLGGDPIPCARALVLGIIDRLSSDSDFLSASLAYARELVAAGHGPRRLRDRSVPGGMPDVALIERQRTLAARKFPGVEAREAIIECVEAAVSLEFDAGIALSRRRFEQCRRSDTSRALRHLFFAERARRARSEPRPVRAVGVLGAGTMGSGIAISLASAGFAVTLVDSNSQALSAGLERAYAAIGAALSKGRLDAAAAAAATARIQGSDILQSLGDADLVVEAVFESLTIKQDVFAALGRICRPGAVLASNTSTLDIDAIAEASGRPQDVIGMHFFSPANIMRLVEIVRGRSTSPAVVATVNDVSRRMGKLGVVVGNCFGFVGNRMLYAYGRENQLMLLEGATPTQIDSALESFGMAMGPNAVGDLAGLDVGYRVRRERKAYVDDPRYYRVADMLVEAGRLGQKSGRGAFSYSEGSRRPIRDSEVEAIIEAESQRLHIPRRDITADEIKNRCVFSLINEGALILSEGIADSPADIDAIWCNGYGFPRYRGGPMFYADTIGIAKVLTAIRGFCDTLGARYWTPAPLLVEIASLGESFDDWHNRRTTPTGN
jgi:3-hydroxyacyl-CoA dehydrogenase